MNKKLLTLAVLTLFSVALTTGLVVNYLSNSVKADVEILSPMVLTISEDGENWLDSISLPNMYTGGNKVVTFYTREQNLADESVIGDTENTIYNPKGITCDDFESVILSTKPEETGDYILIGDVMDMELCVQDGDKRVKFTFEDQDWEARQVELNKIDVTFADVIGKYTFTSRIVPAVVG